MKRFLLTLIGIIAIATGMNAETYKHQFSKGELSKDGGSVVLKDDNSKLENVQWTASSATSIGWNANGKGIQLGSSSVACPNFSITTSVFSEFTIKSVTVNSCIGSGGDAKCAVKVGDTTSDNYTLTQTPTDYKFECNTKGDITISWESTKKAIFIKSIEIVYEIPADMLDIEEPVFVTKTDSIYADKVKVTAETIDQELVLYYTVDGTDPSYEDYNSDPRVGTTKCSKYWVLYEDLTDSVTVNTIRAMAVKVDGEQVYKSDIVEEKYIVSATKPYIPATAITEGNKYAFVANDSIADALVPSIEKGYLQGRKTAKSEKFIEAVNYDAFTFTAKDGGYTIQDAAGRYMYIDGNEFAFAQEAPATDAVWSVSIKDGKAEIKNGNNTIYYVKNEDKFGCYATAEAEMELPELYMLREYPQATITPGNGSEVKGLTEIIIACEEGISVSDNFKLKALGNGDKNGNYEVSSTYNCEQVDANTLKFTIDQPLKSNDNIELNLVIEGNIYLNPDVMSYPITIINKWINNICSYKHIGDAPAAEVTDVTPANNSKVESLSYILFTFSNYVGKTENAEKSVKLHLEGSDEMIAIEYTTLKENSDSEHLAQMQGALKVTEPITKNGTYILEIEEGYFEDRNGKAVKGMTLKYIVENETAIENIIAEGETEWVVYNVTGVKVLETTNAKELDTLSKGIYIINGQKRLIK